MCCVFLRAQRIGENPRTATYFTFSPSPSFQQQQKNGAYDPARPIRASSSLTLFSVPISKKTPHIEGLISFASLYLVERGEHQHISHHPFHGE